MAFVLKDSTLKAIADAIREKEGTTDLIKVSELGSKIKLLKNNSDLPVEPANVGDIYIDKDGKAYELNAENKWVERSDISITTDAEEGDITSGDGSSGYTEGEI